MYYFKNGKLIESDETVDEVVQYLKNKLIMYMIQNHNISWLNDETEQEFYKLLFESIEPIILGRVLLGEGRPFRALNPL